jgi:serine O-acetyltransferase
MAAEFNGFSDFLDLLRGDWIANEKSLTRPGYQALLVHRIGSWVMGLPFLPKLLLAPFYAVCYWTVRNVYGIELPHRTKVGRRFNLAHQSGIVIHPFAVIGDDCMVRQNVTIGAALKVEAPKIGNRVEIGAGAVILGGITIGDDVRIGPNTVVMMSVPANSSVVAPPPRVFPRSTAPATAKESAPTCAQTT